MEKLINNPTPSQHDELMTRESKFSWKRIKKSFGKVYAFFYGNPPAIIGGLLLSIVLAGAIFALFYQRTIRTVVLHDLTWHPIRSTY
ncbi:Binding-protein-dependent transport system inner membrane component [Vibrio sp. B1REV9]|nr:Binding-protein-dependent transport system inner membrane component [Vibrio sp. B1REV9]